MGAPSLESAMTGIVFERKKPNLEKLRAFGFSENAGVYTSSAAIVDGQLQVSVTISRSGAVSTRIFDSVSGDEYTLHRAESACGPFVGQVRADVEKVLLEIADTCFEPDVFKSEAARQIIQYVRETHRDELEFLWPRFPKNAIFRRKDTGKWYAALLTISRRKLGLDSDDVVEILDLRGRPENIEAAIDGEKYFPGYHMNKKHWFTLCLDGSVPIEEICRRIDASHELAVK